MEWTTNDREKIEWSNIWYEDANNMDNSRIALIGDSVTRGIRGRLNELMEDCCVDLLATSCQIEDQLLYKQIDLFAAAGYSYKTIMLQFGAQHLGKNRCCEQQSYRDEFEKQYIQLVRYIQSSFNRCNFVILSGTPCRKKEDLTCFDEWRNAEIIARNDIFKNCADLLEIKYLDIYDFVEMGGYPYKDYIHMQEQGLKCAAEYIYKRTIGI